MKQILTSMLPMLSNGQKKTYKGNIKMKIYNHIRATDNYSKKYLENNFIDMVVELKANNARYADAECAVFGKEDQRGGFNISFYDAKGGSCATPWTFRTSKELVAFVQGFNAVKRGF